MESSGEEWQVVKPKKQRKKKEEDPSPKTKSASAETKLKAKGGKEKSPSPSPPPSQPAVKSVEQQKAKKSEQKKASIMKMPLNTKEQMAYFIKELVMNTPPPSNKLSIAAIGEKIMTVTRNSWSKKYKSSFGSLGGFIESQKDLFTVIGDDVYLAGTVRPPSPSKSPKAADPKAKAESARKRQPTKQETSAKAPSRKQTKSHKASHHAVSNQEQGIGCLKALAVIGLIGAVILFTLASVNAIDLKSLQDRVQKFTAKR